MSKGAVLAMTLSVARDYLREGIRCNCLCPARVHTPFVDGYLEKNYPNDKERMFRQLSQYQPIGRIGTSEEIAAAARLATLPVSNSPKQVAPEPDMRAKAAPAFSSALCA